jgi:DNA-binding CsgD family transcriptional regulator
MVLTDRQIEIVKAAAEGLSDQQIADRLSLSVHTIGSHWKNIREKLGSINRAAVICKVLTSERQLSESEELLIVQSAEINELIRTLESTNAKLKAAVADNQRLLAEQMSSKTRIVHELNSELKQLRELDRSMTEQSVILHEGEYGASWGKTFMSPSIRITGYSAEEWTTSQVTVYDFVNFEHLAPGLKTLEATVANGKSKCVIIYRGTTRDGREVRWADFMRLAPVNEDGLGTYQSFAIDLSEWETELRFALEHDYPE